MNESIRAVIEVGDLAERLVTLGEVHTGLLQNSSAVSPELTGRLLNAIPGERVFRSDRPISYLRSPPVLTGVDCLLPDPSGSKVRGIGTVVSRAAITGGHVVQGSAHVIVDDSGGDPRRPWSHYLSRPGVVETVGKSHGKQVGGGFLGSTTRPGYLDLAAIGRRALDTIQDRPELDHQAPFRYSRTCLRWLVDSVGGDGPPVTFTIVNDTNRIIRLPHRGLDIAAQVELCEDVALHDWLLTTLLSLIDRSRIGVEPRSAVVDRLRPAVDHLLHLWMPAARIDPALAAVWLALERRPGLTRQWQLSIDRVRDQLALETLARLTPGMTRV